MVRNSLGKVENLVINVAKSCRLFVNSCIKQKLLTKLFRNFNIYEQQSDKLDFYGCILIKIYSKKDSRGNADYSGKVVTDNGKILMVI
jgi:hypothetical protein